MNIEKELVLNVRFQDLKTLLSTFECINCVSWVRSSDYREQIYVSPTYEHVWGRSCKSLYRNPQSWYSTLVSADRKEQHEFNTRIVNKYINNTVFFRIERPNGELRYIRDTCFSVFDQKGKQLAIAGISENLTKDLWLLQKSMSSNQCVSTTNNSLSLITEYFNSQKNSASDDENTQKKNFWIRIAGDDVRLTRREVETLYHVIRGKNAKKIARDMGISYRTIEMHINNIKNKTSSHTKSNLISKIDIRYYLDFIEIHFPKKLRDM